MSFRYLLENLMTEQAEDFVKFKAADDQISNTLDQEVARSNSLHTIREQEESEKNEKRYEYAEAFITTAWMSMVFVALLLIADDWNLCPFNWQFCHARDSWNGTC